MYCKTCGAKMADDAKQQAAAQTEAKPESNVIQMHEKVERPEMLVGSTYKIKTPLSEHS